MTGCPTRWSRPPTTWPRSRSPPTRSTPRWRRRSRCMRRLGWPAHDAPAPNGSPRSSAEATAGDRRRHRPPAALEEVRVRYLGRKAELPNLLRGVAELPPEQRGATGKAANQARQALEAAIEQRGGELAGAELEQRLIADRIDVTLPADPLPAIGRLHLMTQTRREIEDVFIGLGFNVAEGPEVETRLLQLRRAQPRADAPGAAADRHLLRQAVREDVDIFDPETPLLRVHTSPDADPGDGEPAAADLHHRPRPRVPARLRRDPHAAVPSDRGAGGRRRHHAGRPQGHAARRSPARSSARSARSGCARTSSRSPSRASRSTSPASTAPTGITADGQRCPLCKGTAWIEILGSGMVDPNVLGHVARATAMTPSRCRGSRSGWGSSGSPCSSTASPTCGCSTTTTSACWSSSEMGTVLRPARLAARVLRARPRRVRRSPSAWR